MSLAGRNLLSRSAFRHTIILCGIVIFVLLISGFMLNLTIQSQVQTEIDDLLELSYKEFVDDNVAATDLLAWIAELSEDGGYYNFAYQGPNNFVAGGVFPEIFDVSGFQTVIASDLFESTFISEFSVILEEVDGIDQDKWRVFVGTFDGGKIAMFEPIENVEDALKLVTTFITYVGSVLVILILLTGGFLAKRQQNRIDIIDSGLRRIGRGNLEAKIAPKLLRDDLDHIMLGIDDTAQQLSNSMSQLRLFTQNAAHELNTPLARLRATLDQLPENIQKDAALEEADTIIRTLSGVQRIARLSHRPDLAAFADIDLLDVSELMRDLYFDVIEERGQSFELVCGSTQVIRGDFQLIAQLASNLVENGMRHAGENAIIALSVEGRTLTISDNGKGMSQSLSKDAFVPFERDAGAGGSGLGLALVKAVADYHSAEVLLNQENGFAISVRFPKPR